jgi:gas vesicle protein
MRNRFISGMITGGMIGATTSMYLYSKTNRKQRKKLAKRSKTIIKGMTPFMNLFQSISSFNPLR